MAAEKQSKKHSINLSTWKLFAAVLGLAIIVALMIYKLGSLMHGITVSENNVLNLPLGWHGLYHDPLNLPINLMRSAEFKYLSPIGQTLLRLPNAILGGITIIAFYILMWLWYGSRTAVIGTAMFATSAWTLHVSRYSSYSVEYLLAITLFLLSTAILRKHPKNKYTYIAINLLWGALLYIPGMVWFIGLNVYRQRRELKYGARQQSGWLTKPIYYLSTVVWIPLLAHYLIKTPKSLRLWLGLPLKLHSPLTMFKDFVAVFVHIFIRGPQYPALWLGKAPILDLFSLVAVLVGIYFYITHLKASRSLLLFICFGMGTILIALGGIVDLSIVMPIVYIWIAAGVAYLLQQWLQVFPKNPIARGLGYGLIIIAVSLSCVYNLRSYFVAWPHNPTSQAVFDDRR